MRDEVEAPSQKRGIEIASSVAPFPTLAQKGLFAEVPPRQRLVRCEEVRNRESRQHPLPVDGNGVGAKS